MDLNMVFQNSFDTFKVFDNLNIQQASLTNYNSPKSIWQILNHLIIWQDYQLTKLRDGSIEDISEVDTWLTEGTVKDQGLLDNSIEKFAEQIEGIKTELSKLETKQQDFGLKIKIVQDLSVHLSFHVGEIVLIMRQNGYYPMPNEMNNFLST